MKKLNDPIFNDQSESVIFEDISDKVLSQEVIDDCSLVFVYGTLKKGYGNHRLLRAAKYLGVGYSVDKYFLAGRGIPFAIPEKLSRKENKVFPIQGEIYDISSYKDTILQNLDWLEGEGVLYHRRCRKFQLRTENSEVISTVSAFIYEYENSGEWHEPCKIIDEHYVWVGSSRS